MFKQSMNGPRMNGSQSSLQEGLELGSLPDDALQAVLLEGVSRTFALTIPQLPEGLAKPVSNAYLLCRIVDTIEDEVALSSEQKRRFCQQFTAVVAGGADPATLAAELAPLLSEQTIPAEHELIRSDSPRHRHHPRLRPAATGSLDPVRQDHGQGHGRISGS